MPLHLLISLVRVLADLQSGCNWIRSHGIHWLLCEADSYSHVSTRFNYYSFTHDANVFTPLEITF